MNKDIKIAICAICKDEGNYINEWINYHINLGFDTIYLFDNNDINDIQLETIIQPSENVIIDKRFFNKHDKCYQSTAYRLFYNENKEKYDWIAYIDIDEFFNLNTSIKNFLANEIFNEYDSIKFVWKIMTDNDIVYANNNYSVSRFGENGIFTYTCKSIIRTTLPDAGCISAHGYYGAKTCDVYGKKCNNGVECNIKQIYKNVNDFVEPSIYIKHYRFKTIEEFMTHKMKIWHQTYIDISCINLDEFFRFNKITKEKLQYLEDHNIQYIKNK